MPQRQWRWQCHSAGAAAHAHAHADADDDNDEYERNVADYGDYGDGVDLFKALQPNRNCQIHQNKTAKEVWMKKTKNLKTWKKHCDP